MKFKKAMLLAAITVAACGPSSIHADESNTTKTTKTTKSTPSKSEGSSTVSNSKKEILSNYWMYIGVLAVLLLLIVLMVWIRRRSEKS